MAHKTLIGGTAYEISGGKTLVGGTGYSIDKGKTLVGGTAYDVGFALPMVTLTIGSQQGASRPDKAYIIIDGQTYDGSVSHTISVPIGTIVACYSANYVLLNGEFVTSGTNATYYYEVTTNADFNIISNTYIGQVQITES